MLTSKAVKLLAKCEAELRTLVSTAASTGDYATVMRITSWAQQVSAIASGGNGSSVKKRTKTESLKRPVAKGNYPRFARRGDQILKFGWSKAENSEYEHKAPRQAAFVLARAVAVAGRDGRVFQINSLLQLRGSTDGSEIPDYQVYLLIAWWRSAGLLDQHGRQGYSIPKAEQLLQAVESAWDKLPEE